MNNISTKNLPERLPVRPRTDWRENLLIPDLETNIGDGDGRQVSGHCNGLEDPGVGVQEHTADPSHLSLPHLGCLHVDSLATTDLRPETRNILTFRPAA